MKITFGNRALAMLSGVALATVFVAGCTEEAHLDSPVTTPPAATRRHEDWRRDEAGSPARGHPGEDRREEALTTKRELQSPIG